MYKFFIKPTIDFLFTLIILCLIWPGIILLALILSIQNLGTPIFVHEKTTKTVGRVSMAMLYVDLSKIETAVIGSKVEMWGNHISVDEVAKNSGTVGYELLCNISASSRVPLDYI